MIKTEDIIKSIMHELEISHPDYNIYIGTLEENAKYPCFLIYLGLENGKIADTDLIKKTLTVDIVYFNSNKAKDNKDYIAKVQVKDNLEELWLNKNYIKVGNKKIKFDYSINNADDLLNVTLKVIYFNNIVKEIVDYEIIKEIIINTKTCNHNPSII